METPAEKEVNRNEMIERGNNNDLAYARQADNDNNNDDSTTTHTKRKRNGTLASVKIDDIVYLLAHSALSFQ